MRPLRVLLAIALSALACSSANPSTSIDAAPTVVHPTPTTDAAPAATTPADAAAPARAFDETTGQPCTTDSDCISATGPGQNRCSNSYSSTVAGVVVQLWPTPVCIVPPTGTPAGNCDPAPPSDPAGQLVHYCDGDDTSASPGVCFPDTDPPQPMHGSCLPQCAVSLDGSAAIGCVGTDTCQVFTFVRDVTTSRVTGIGFCQGSCQTDKDCGALGAGYGCQADIGFCTKSTLVRTKAVGEPCTAADSVSGACNCQLGSGTTGFCTSACVVGRAPCPGAMVCDALEPSILDFGDAGTVAVPTQNAGLSGICVAPCAMVDAAADDAGLSSAGCPAQTVCVDQTAAGPDCMPE